MSLARPVFLRILAVSDPSADPLALTSAQALAEAYGAALQVLACVEPPRDLAILARMSGRSRDALLEAAVARGREALDDLIARTLPGIPVAAHLRGGKAYVEITRHAAETGCDLVVKRADPVPGLPRAQRTSTDQHLLRKCPCPVWLQVPGAPPRPRRILAAIDLDLDDAAEPATLAALNTAVIAAARAIAPGAGAEIVVLHAWEAAAEGLVWAFAAPREAGRLSADRYVNEILEARQTAMDALLAGLDPPAEAGLRITPVLARGAPEQAIEAQVRQGAGEVVVMGTLARSGLGGVIIGNTAETFSNSVDGPVLAIKPEGFVSPLLRD